MTSIVTDGVWIRWRCNSCQRRGERKEDALETIQRRITLGEYHCGHCGSRHLSLAIPGPFDKATAERMRAEMEAGSIVGGIANIGEDSPQEDPS